MEGALPPPKLGGDVSDSCPLRTYTLRGRTFRPRCTLLHRISLYARERNIPHAISCGLFRPRYGGVFLAAGLRQPASSACQLSPRHVGLSDGGALALLAPPLSLLFLSLRLSSEIRICQPSVTLPSRFLSGAFHAPPIPTAVAHGGLLFHTRVEDSHPPAVLF